MTAPLICPICGDEARFDERYGPGDEIWLVCMACGGKTDDQELALANIEPDTEVVQ